jgi:hypothetical protein
LRIAKEAGLNERYVKEWLGAMVTGGVVEHNPENDTFWLPPEHALLRSLYFALAGIMDRFYYLKLSLIVLLALIGVKMLLKDVLHGVPGLTYYTLAAIAVIQECWRRGFPRPGQTPGGQNGGGRLGRGTRTGLSRRWEGSRTLTFRNCSGCSLR